MRKVGSGRFENVGTKGKTRKQEQETDRDRVYYCLRVRFKVLYDKKDQDEVPLRGGTATGGFVQR